MFRTTVQAIYSRLFLRRALLGLDTLDLSALLTGSVVRLFQNDFQPTPLSLITDFTEADFTGYAAVAVADWGNVVNLGQEVIGFHANADYVATGTAVTNTVYGYYVPVDDINIPWAICERFATPVPIANIGDFLALEALMPLALRQMAQ